MRRQLVVDRKGGGVMYGGRRCYRHRVVFSGRERELFVRNREVFKRLMAFMPAPGWRRSVWVEIIQRAAGVAPEKLMYTFYERPTAEGEAAVRRPCPFGQPGT